MPRPLENLRVVDFTHALAGPYATNVLAQLGAEVIKVESPHGDLFRAYGDDRELAKLGMGIPFVGSNAGKKSVSLDLKKEEAREIVRKLIAESDIVVENMRPGTIKRLGFSYEVCKELRPDIIYCSISGYGQEGPMRDYPAIDNVVQATSGMMMVSGSEEDPPIRVGVPAADTYTATMAALAILAATTQRARFGTGQFIDVAMMDASLIFMYGSTAQYAATGAEHKRTGNMGFSGQPTSGLFRCSDGHLVSLGVVQHNQWVTFCKAAKREDLLEDPRFNTIYDRIDNAPALVEIIEQLFLTKTGEEWERQLSLGGVPCGMIRTVSEAMELEQVKQRNLRVPLNIPGMPNADLGVLGTGFLFAEDGPAVDGPPPFLSENGEEILSMLGYSNQQIADFLASGILQPSKKPETAK
ncbi:CaiB/BaiF CoA transferase family protein [Alteromonas lipolytica]|uniref:Formyl-CoA transferase n=1 Tax=Alteromonas lipolytica TaxID=1856405 RepID=A0A1E8FDE6_9ALTE|nr:CoA transferase [Alteromonas lipolytica]OFI33493.1 hypothetical protein BFC17_04335 [Alteromonas lipolytica]GGF59155.1 CoA transferase [Alteromonas lipolytica]